MPDYPTAYKEKSRGRPQAPGRSKGAAPKPVDFKDFLKDLNRPRPSAPGTDWTKLPAYIPKQLLKVAPKLHPWLRAASLAYEAWKLLKGDDDFIPWEKGPHKGWTLTGYRQKGPTNLKETHRGWNTSSWDMYCTSTGSSQYWTPAANQSAPPASASHWGQWTCYNNTGTHRGWKVEHWVKTSTTHDWLSPDVQPLPWKMPFPSLAPETQPIQKPDFPPVPKPWPEALPAPGEQPSKPENKPQPKEKTKPKPAPKPVYDIPLAPFPVVRIPSTVRPPGAPAPLPVAPPVIVIEPGTGPKPGEGTPAPGPTAPGTQPAPAPGGVTTKPGGGASRTRPGRGTKEKKINVKSVVHNSVHVALNFVTEGLDFIDVLYDGLPDGCKPRRGKDRNGKRYGVSAENKMKAIYRCWDNLDDEYLSKTVANYLNNQVEDMIYGMLGKQIGKATRNLNLTTGLNRALKQHQGAIMEQVQDNGALTPELNYNPDTGEWSVSFDLGGVGGEQVLFTDPHG